MLLWFVAVVTVSLWSFAGWMWKKSLPQLRCKNYAEVPPQTSLEHCTSRQDEHIGYIFCWQSYHFDKAADVSGLQETARTGDTRRRLWTSQLAPGVTFRRSNLVLCLDISNAGRADSALMLPVWHFCVLAEGEDGFDWISQHTRLFLLLFSYDWSHETIDSVDSSWSFYMVQHQEHCVFSKR